jgi:hypothetical protein
VAGIIETVQATELSPSRATSRSGWSVSRPDRTV